MRFLNNLKAYDKAQKKQLIFAGIVVSFVIIAFVVFALLFSHNKKVDEGLYYDPGSGETVSSPAGKTAENYGGTFNQPIFLGFDKLLDVGLSKNQLVSLKSLLHGFSINSKKNYKEFSVTVKTIGVGIPGREDPGIDTTLSFDMVADRSQTYNIKVIYHDISTVTLQVFDNGTKVHESTTPTEDAAE